MVKLVVFGGGGKVARHLARLAVGQGHQVVSVVRNDVHDADLKALGAQPALLSLETVTVPDLTSFLKTQAPDAVIFAAGAGGKEAPERTRLVDYDGAVKVFDACEAAGDGAKRVLVVSAIDVRDRAKGVPKYYTPESVAMSDRMWGAIGRYMQAKYDADANLHTRKNLAWTILRPGGLTDEPSPGVELGVTQLKKTSREAVAQTLLALALNPGAAGLTLDVMDGTDSPVEAVKKVVADRVDAWTAQMDV